jgi:branched-chain amino acid transport system substrate-binding protein
MWTRFFSLLLAAWLSVLPFAIAEGPSAPIRMGVTLPLTGGGAEWGIAAKNGFELATSERPDLSRAISFKFEDTQLEPKNAVTAFNKLVSTDKVQLVYDFGAATTGAMGPLADRAQIPLLSSSFDPSVAAGRAFVIRFANYSGQYADQVLRYLRSKGYRRYAVVATENAFFKSLVDAFRTKLNEQESLVILEEVAPDVVSFKTIISKLKHAAGSQKIDALGLYVHAAQGVQFARELNEQKFRIPLFGSDAFESPAVIKDSQGNMEGLVYPNNTVSDSFRKRYEDRFGNTTQITFAGSTYDLAMLIGDILLGPSAPRTSAEILDRLKQSGERVGVLGPFRFREETGIGKYFEFPIVVKIVKDGQIQNIEVEP